MLGPQGGGGLRACLEGFGIFDGTEVDCGFVGLRV